LIAARTVALLVVLSLAGACRERGRIDPDIRMASSHEREDASQPAGQGQGEGPSVPTRLVVPPEVGEAYSGIRLAWTDAATGKQGTVEVPIGGTARVPGTNLDVRADVFLPSFSMSQEAITSSGLEEENPAARIQVFEDGKGVFAGWIFTRFPDVHPFTHPRVSFRLEGGVRRTTT
jgi:hypothetical protein